MATRLDRVTTKASPTHQEVDLQPTALLSPRAKLETELDQSAASHTALVPAEAVRQLPIRSLGGAMAAWLALTFGLCHVAMPAVGVALGVDAGVMAHFWYMMPAFALASFAAVVAAVAAGPRLRLHTSSPRDPVIAATLGGLGVAAVVQNTSALVVPYTALGPWELAAGLGMNVLEMSMLGMMFASFTRRASVALALGGGFQLVVLGLALTLMSIL